MGTLVYIIAAIVWIVYSYYNKKSKQEAERAKRQASPPSAPGGNKDFSQVLDEILQQAKAKEQQQRTGSAPVPARQVEKPVAKKEQPVTRGYEFGNYETLEDDYVDEEAAYSDFATKNYKPTTLETINTEQQHVTQDLGDLTASKDEHYLKQNAYDEDFDFDMEKAVIYSEILARPKF